MLLDDLNINYKIIQVPADGNCFYHSVAHQVNYLLSFKQIRQIVSQELNDTDLGIFNTIHDTTWSLPQLKKKILNYNYDCIWADNIEIAALVRALPTICIVVVNEENKVINKIQNGTNISTVIFILKKNQHYCSLQLSDTNKKRLTKLLKRTDYKPTIQHNKRNMKFIASTVISITFLFIFVEILNSPLHNR
jgi:hypothetical protein